MHPLRAFIFSLTCGLALLFPLSFSYQVYQS